MKDAVIFDLDGVLIDSELIWARKEFGIFCGLIPGWDRDKQMQLAGKSVSDIYSLLTGRYGLGMDSASFTHMYDGMAGEIYSKDCSLNPGAEDFLRGLRKDGFRTALATSSSRHLVDIVIGRFGMAGWFDALVTATDAGGRGKPAPDIYNLCVERLALDKNKCVAIEDSSNGVKSAKSAGLFCIGFVSDPAYDLSEADIVVKSFGELSPGMIKKL